MAAPPLIPNAHAVIRNVLGHWRSEPEPPCEPSAVGAPTDGGIEVNLGAEQARSTDRVTAPGLRAGPLRTALPGLSRLPSKDTVELAPNRCDWRSPNEVARMTPRFVRNPALRDAVLDNAYHCVLMRAVLARVLSGEDTAVAGFGRPGPEVLARGPCPAELHAAFTAATYQRHADATMAAAVVLHASTQPILPRNAGPRVFVVVPTIPRSAAVAAAIVRGGGDECQLVVHDGCRGSLPPIPSDKRADVCVVTPAALLEHCETGYYTPVSVSMLWLSDPDLCVAAFSSAAPLRRVLAMPKWQPLRHNVVTTAADPATLRTLVGEDLQLRALLERTFDGAATAPQHVHPELDPRHRVEAPKREREEDTDAPPSAAHFVVAAGADPTAVLLWNLRVPLPEAEGPELEADVAQRLADVTAKCAPYGTILRSGWVAMSPQELATYRTAARDHRLRTGTGTVPPEETAVLGTAPDSAVTTALGATPSHCVGAVVVFEDVAGAARCQAALHSTRLGHTVLSAITVDAAACPASPLRCAYLSVPVAQALPRCVLFRNLTATPAALREDRELRVDTEQICSSFGAVEAVRCWTRPLARPDCLYRDAAMVWRYDDVARLYVVFATAAAAAECCAGLGSQSFGGRQVCAYLCPHTRCSGDDDGAPLPGERPVDAQTLALLRQ